MRITEDRLRRLLREEARRTRLFEVGAVEPPPPASPSAPVQTYPSAAPAQAASDANAAAGSANATIAAAGANPAAGLDAASKTQLQDGLSNIGMTGLNVDKVTPQTLVAKYLEFLNVGVMNTDLWFGDGQFPSGFTDENKARFKKLFVDKWNDDQNFATEVSVKGSVTDTNELINILDSDEQSGGFDDFTRVTGQWNDDAGLEIVNIHNAFIALKKLLPGTPNINPSSLQPEGGAAAAAAPTTPGGGAAATPGGGGAAAAGAGAARGKGVPVVAGVKEIQAAIGMDPKQQDGAWGPTTQQAVRDWAFANVTAGTVKDAAGADVRPIDIATKWSTTAATIATVKGAPVNFKPKGTPMNFLQFINAVKGAPAAAPAAPAPARKPPPVSPEIAGAPGATAEGSWRRGSRLVESDRNFKINWGR